MYIPATAVRDYETLSENATRCLSWKASMSIPDILSDDIKTHWVRELHGGTGLTSISVVWLKEPMSAQQALGGALIVAAMVVSEALPYMFRAITIPDTRP